MEYSLSSRPLSGSAWNQMSLRFFEKLDLRLVFDYLEGGRLSLMARPTRRDYT
jgi:hypothetical protein